MASIKRGEKSPCIDELLRPERELWAEGFCFIAGVDEAGRGPLAGPVAAAAVVLPRGIELPDVFDSKQLSDSSRRALRDEIYALPGVSIGLSLLDADVIDEINILQATHRAMREAVSQLENVDCVLVDGLAVRGFKVESRNLVKGDSLSASIAAASIIAKVARDDFMIEMDKLYPEYGFAVHKGYGTAAHLQALQKYGVTPIHRKSFRPVREIIDPPPEQLELL
ncbi:MAG: ribonuclease HII [Lentisphaeria bacterium]|nr:ribonuclease HII [Lentisphaeria bacterium]MBO5990555.1 ribonuclease HII [Lentisphaeria bacterium]